MTSPESTQSDRGARSTVRGTPRTATLDLPFLTAQLRIPELPAPRLPRFSGREVRDAAQGISGLLPSPEQLAYYTGLGLMAALDVIDWPVAVAIGAGTAVARRRGSPRPLLPPGRQRPADGGTETAPQMEMTPPRRRRPRAEPRKAAAAAPARRPGRPRKTAASPT
jgi:hypothetical protein